MDGRPHGSGARDLRLSRDGSLVRAWRESLTLDATGAAAVEALVPLATGKDTLTTYVFSRVDVNSSDATATVNSAAVHAAPTTYALTISVNRHAHAALSPVRGGRRAGHEHRDRMPAAVTRRRRGYLYRAVARHGGDQGKRSARSGAAGWNAHRQYRGIRWRQCGIDVLRTEHGAPDSARADGELTVARTQLTRRPVVCERGPPRRRR